MCHKLTSTQYEAGKPEHPPKLSAKNLCSNGLFFKSQVSCRVNWTLSSDFHSVKFHWCCHPSCHNWWAESLKTFIHFDLPCFLTRLWVAKIIQHPCQWYNVMFTLEQTTKAQRGSRGIAPSLFNLDARWGWASGLVWTLVENLTPTRIRFPDGPARSKLLYQLRYPGPHSPHVDVGMNMEHWWLCTDRWKLKYLEKNLLQCHFVHNKSHMDWPVVEPGLLTVKGWLLTE